MNTLAPKIKPISISELRMTDLGFVSLSATDMGENIQECCVLFQPLVGPCNFAAFINVEYSTSEELLKRYNSFNGINAFIAEYGPLKFVPKVNDTVDDVALEMLLESGQWDQFHLEHCEDFISPYSTEDNLVISNAIKSTLDCLHNLETFGATDEVLGFLSNPEFEIDFSSDDDLSFALTPFTNSLNELLNSPVISVNSHKILSADEVLIKFDVRGKKENPQNADFDFVELNYAIRAKLDHSSKSIKSINVTEANALVLSYDHDEQNHLIYHPEQWLNDCFTNIQMKNVFDQDVLNQQINALCEKSPVYHKALEAEIFA